MGVRPAVSCFDRRGRAAARSRSARGLQRSAVPGAGRHLVANAGECSRMTYPRGRRRTNKQDGGLRRRFSRTWPTTCVSCCGLHKAETLALQRRSWTAERCNPRPRAEQERVSMVTSARKEAKSIFTTLYAPRPVARLRKRLWTGRACIASGVRGSAGGGSAFRKPACAQKAAFRAARQAHHFCFHARRTVAGGHVRPQASPDPRPRQAVSRRKAARSVRGDREPAQVAVEFKNYG